MSLEHDRMTIAELTAPAMTPLEAGLSILLVIVTGFCTWVGIWLKWRRDRDMVQVRDNSAAVQTTAVEIKGLWDHIRTQDKLIDRQGETIRAQQLLLETAREDCRKLGEQNARQSQQIEQLQRENQDLRAIVKRLGGEGHLPGRERIED
jgi:hypothetical protein